MGACHPPSAPCASPYSFLTLRRPTRADEELASYIGYVGVESGVDGVRYGPECNVRLAATEQRL
jgi:hypothetical protein